MNRFIAGLSMMLWAAPLLGTEKTSEGKSATSPLPRSEAVAFAQQLDKVVHFVAETYVKPVPHSALLLAALTGLHEAARLPVPPSLSADAQNAKNEQQRLELIARIRQSLGDLPVLQGSKGIEVGVRAMCQVLDPYCQPVVLKEGFQVLREKPISPFGLDWEMPTGASTAVITKVDPGGPAQRNGLRPGDRITHVNGRPANEQATLLLPPATDSPAPDRAAEEVVLTLVRPATKLTRTVTLPAEDFRPESVFGVVRQEDNSWDFMVDREHQIAQVRIGSFAEGTAEELLQTLTALKAKGLRGLILDLRWCPGGFLKEAVASARLFLDEVPIAKTKMRNGQSEEYVGKRDVNFLDFPIIVLVNHDTLGGAELIAAALQDNKRALVAGQRTFGKGTIQILTVVVTPNIGLKLSAGTFLRPNGKNLHRFPDSKATDDWGVLPDPKLEFRISPDLSKQLREWWLWQTLRPGSSREVLPLDDPATDPQRQAALKALLRMLDKSASGPKQSVSR
jgi:carboxyl-terminal processing protease